MRKLFVAFLTLGLVVALAMPASALENIFGGYWRTRAMSMTNYTGEDKTELGDATLVDTRTRLYYTAKFSDNFKFVNKLEWDVIWGDTIGGDIGADGGGSYDNLGTNTSIIKVKNSYADFVIGPIETKIGLQPTVLARGFMFDDDFAGLILSYSKDNITVPFIWMKAYEGYWLSSGPDTNDKDVDIYGLAPVVKLDKITVNPYFVWVTSSDASVWPSTAGLGVEKLNVYYLGADVDANLGKANVWFTGIYEFGSADPIGGGDSTDISSYLVGVGGDAEVGPAGVHGQFFYASGDDDATDNDYKAFYVPRGQSYDWAPIMGGNGIFDYNNSANSPGPTPTDVMAFNIGASMKPMDKLEVGLDLWYAALAEDNANGDKDLGTEVDLLVTYNLIENMKVDVLAGYLFAGDATYKGDNDADPYLLGAQFSFGF
ncbi:MAG: hypothetical protein NT072_05490 [Deltaproteobacteria bacterium]|nr:hypothetical protein [Deltaproteobacteria bacterium]